jgi:hypothetical protein
MKALAFLSTTMLTVSVVYADEDSKLYFKTEGGAAFQQHVHVTIPGTLEVDLKTEAGPRFDFSVGYQFKESLSAELNTGLVITKLQDVGRHDFYQIPIMANLIWQPQEGKLGPFVGAGIGGIEIILDPNVLPASTDSDLVFGGQIMAGFRYRFRKHFEVGLTYKFLYATTAVSDSTGASIGPSLTHSVLAAFVCKF